MLRIFMQKAETTNGIYIYIYITQLCRDICNLYRLLCFIWITNLLKYILLNLGMLCCSNSDPFTSIYYSPTKYKVSPPPSILAWLYVRRSALPQCFSVPLPNICFPALSLLQPRGKFSLKNIPPIFIYYYWAFDILPHFFLKSHIWEKPFWNCSSLFGCSLNLILYGSFNL